MRIVGIGGGTGLPVLLSGLKEFSESEESPDITAIVTVADNGGSTGALREAFRMPAMGDIRKCMIALAPEDSILTSVCAYRFDHRGGFEGHSLGNLILSALYQMSGDFADAVRQACELLRLKGRVLPATDQPVSLCALYEDGGIARGESNIPQPGRRIRRVWLEHAAGGGPSRPPGAPGVLDAIRQADGIVFGPGSLYTSIIPNLLVNDVPETIRQSSAVKIYVSNLMTEPGETDGYSAADHVRALLEYVSPIDVCVINSAAAGAVLADRYLRSGSTIVSAAEGDEDDIRRCGVIPVAAPLLKQGEIKARHDPGALARLVTALARGLAGAQEIICSQQNGR